MPTNNDRPRDERKLPSIQIGSRSVTAYDPGLALLVCEKVAEGEKLKTVLKLDGLPCRSTWYRWCMMHPDLKIMYDVARQISAEGMEENLLEVAEDLLSAGGKLGLTAIQLDRIKVAFTQLRWSASRRDPAKFAERPQVQTVIPVQINTTLNMGQPGAVSAAGGNIYTMLSARPEQPEIEDAEFEEVANVAGVAEDAGEASEGPQKPERPAFAKKPYPQRLRKKHKTPGQIFATIGAQSRRGTKKNVTNKPAVGAE